MNRTLVHRGPDAEGYFCEGPVGLGHRRLSIIDLSTGSQPMSSDDGRFVIVFNGEIYNFQEIRTRLEKSGVSFKTHSDTEVLLKFYIHEGEKCLTQLNGMFSFVVWDKKERRLFAARDRMGKKPFYYWNTPWGFAFASECKAFLPHPRFSPQLDTEALVHFFQYEYVPAPYSIFHGVKKLAAGHCLIWDQSGLEIKRYWDIPLTSSASKKKSDWDEQEVQSKIVSLLDQAVETRLVSDVPLGVFLSGGLDSSSVVALMARHREGKDIKTFSINFDEPSFDESAYSSLIAKKFSTTHYQQTLTASKMIDILPEVADFLDEPFADYSIIPTYLLSKFTRQHVTVALGGDGSDELFAGYPTFYAGRLASKIPSFFQKGMKAFARHLPVSDKDMSFEFKLKQFLYGAGYPPVLRNQVWLGAFHREEQLSLFEPSSPAHTLLQDSDPLDLVRQVMLSCPSKNRGDQMLYFYQKFYLCDDILVKADRASMAASLEVRAPFLDKNFVEYVSTLPFEFKMKGSQTKFLLKKALESVLPHDIIYRPKKGFGIPIAQWLKEELRPVLQQTLHHDRIKKAGIFNPIVVDRLVGEHLAGKKNNRKPLFALLMFEWWRERFLKN